jgi:hypothetical protein
VQWGVECVWHTASSHIMVPVGSARNDLSIWTPEHSRFCSRSALAPMRMRFGRDRCPALDHAHTGKLRSEQASLSLYSLRETLACMSDQSLGYAGVHSLRLPSVDSIHVYSVSNVAEPVRGSSCCTLNGRDQWKMESMSRSSSLLSGLLAVRNCSKCWENRNVCFWQVSGLRLSMYLRLSSFSFALFSYVLLLLLLYFFEFCTFCINLKVSCLHPVACTRSGSGFPSNATLV